RFAVVHRATQYSVLSTVRGLPAPLELPDVFVIHRPAAAPPLQDLVPPDRSIVRTPALVGGVEVRWDRPVDDVLPALRREVGRDLQADLVAERHHFRHPDLTQLVVAATLEPVVELFGMLLLAVG